MAKAQKRNCTAKTKAGKACRAAALSGRDVCISHSDTKTREKTGFVANNGKQGRPKSPRVVDILRERLEARADEVIDVYLDAAKASRSVAVGDEVVEIPDHSIRLKAVEALNDRGYGKPAQAVELAGKDGGPIEFNEEAFADPKTRKELDELARRLGTTR